MCCAFWEDAKRWQFRFWCQRELYMAGRCGILFTSQCAQEQWTLHLMLDASRFCISVFSVRRLRVISYFPHPSSGPLPGAGLPFTVIRGYFFVLVSIPHLELERSIGVGLNIMCHVDFVFLAHDLKNLFFFLSAAAAQIILWLKKFQYSLILSNTCCLARLMCPFKTVLMKEKYRI